MPIQRGEVYFVNLSPVVGHEQKGRRPVVVVSNDAINALPLVVVVVPRTRGANIATDYPQNVRVQAGGANLPDETVFLTFQIRALDHSRFTDPPVGVLSPTAMGEMERSLAYTLALWTG